MYLGPLYRLMMPLAARKLNLHTAKDPRQREATYVQRIAEQVAASELDRAVVLAFDRVYAPDGEPMDAHTRYYVPNGYVASAVRTHPDQLLFGASVHPFRKDALEALTRVKARGAVLVKLLPNSHAFDPADDRLGPYYRALAELRLPLLLHGGYEHTIKVQQQQFGNPERFRPALDAGVTLIVAHAGSAGRFHCRETFGAFLKLLETYPNCYGDTSALANYWRSQYISKLQNPDLLERRYGVRLENPFDRLVHGSDFPIPVSPWAFGPSRAGQLKKLPEAAGNPLQKDICLKRLAGIPDSCLTRAFTDIGIGTSPAEG